MDFIIRKDIYGNWWHDYNNNATKVSISDFECVIDEVANTFIIQNKNGSNVPSKAVSIADVKVIDQNISETPIAFSGAVGLQNLLTAKQYPPYRESSIVYDQKIIWRKGHAIVWNETQEFFNANFDSNGLGINLALGWGLCNGNGGRKDFRDRTVVSKGANFSTLYNTGGSANAVLIGHKHKIAKGTADFNSVSGSAPVAFGTNFTIDSESTGLSENGASVPDQSGEGKNMPPYIIAQWVERVSDLIVYYTGSEGGGAVDSVNGQTGVVVIPIPTNTSDLVNDGEDGVNPFITAADVVVPNLEQVTDIGATTTNQITVQNVKIGSNAFGNTIVGNITTLPTGTGTTAIGFGAGSGASGAGGTYIGASAGSLNAFGKNICLSANANASTASADNQFVINTNTKNIRFDTNVPLNILFQFPEVGGRFPISVNGNTADSAGNIVVPSGAVDSVNGQTGVVIIPLDYLPLAGGTMDAGADIFFDNGSKLSEGLYDEGTFGNKGIARTCAVGYEDKWEAGEQYITETGSGIIQFRRFAFNVPTIDDDTTKRYAIGSYWQMRNNDIYICTDATEGAAVWEIYSVAGIPTLQEVVNEDNLLTDSAIVFDSLGNPNLTSSVSINGLAFIENDGVNEEITVFSLDGMQRNLDTNITLLNFETPTNPDNVVLVPNGSGTLALTSDITTPTLQQVLDNNHDLVDNNNFQGTDAGVNNTGTNVNALGEFAASSNTGIAINALGKGAGVDNTGNAVNALGQEAAVGNIGNDVNALGFRAGVENTFNNVNLFGETAQADENGQTVLSKDGTIMARISTAELTASRKYTLQDADGTLAFLDDVTGVPYTGATQDVDLGEFGLLTGNIEFDNTPTNIPIAAGSMVWNDTDGTVDLKLKGGNVTLQIGQEQVIRVVNKTATNVNLLEANYQAVRVTGAQGQRLKVDLAQATTDVLSAETIGLVTETINNNQEGFITTSGLIRNIDTTGTLQSETWADGDVLYLSPTVAGRVTKVKPTAPNHLVIIGYVIHAHATQGSIFVKVDNGYELDELHNVKITTAANGQALTYTSATDIWENKTIIEDTIVDSVTDKAPSQNAVFDALALKQNTSTLIFDSIQKAIMRDNYFWFVPASISAGVFGAPLATSERISGASFLYLNNGAITRGMLSFNTTVVPGIIAFSRRNDALILTGLEVVFTRKIQFNSNVSGQRFFSGISKGNQFSPPTNVEPSTLTDLVGVCQLSTSTNMHVVHNDASGTATTIDLGSSYPCTDSQYNYYITIEQTTTTYIVTVERVTITTGASISTTNTLSTNIPNYATGTIQLITWISNNATAATASYLDGGAIGNIKNQ
jgi:hypothetical protein